MAALGRKLRSGEGGRVSFYCPGCKDQHTVKTGPGGWAFNGDGDRPTFSPSVLVHSGHHVDGHQRHDSCWCTWNAEHPGDPAPFKCYRCHSFVTDGRIRFLDDCTHQLAGLTVDLPDFPSQESP